MLLPSALTPVAIEPEWGSQRSQMLALLKKVERVDIKSAVRHDGTRSYVIEIFECASKNRIPTNRSRQDRPSSPRSPERSHASVARIHRQYAEFAGLQSEVYNHARNAHTLSPCHFCKCVINEVVLGCNKVGRFQKLLLSDEKVEQTLANAVTTILDLIKCNGEVRQCGGQDKVVHVLYEFLFQQGSL